MLSKAKPTSKRSHEYVFCAGIEILSTKTSINMQMHIIMFQCCTETCDQSDSVALVFFPQPPQSLEALFPPVKKNPCYIIQNYEIKSKFGRFSPGETS